MFPLQDDNLKSSRPVFTVIFLVIIVLVFLWQLSLGSNVRWANLSLGMIPATLLGGQSLIDQLEIVPPWMTIFTSMFMHGGWMHLIGNFLFLWVFGRSVEEAMGHGRFLVFYLLCGVFAAMGHALPDINSMIPMIGASGAISGVLGAYLMLYPRARVLVMIPFGFYMHTTQPHAAFLVAFWLFMQVYYALTMDAQQGGVAVGAHIGGFIGGLMLVSLFKRRDVPLFAPAREE